MNKWTVIAVGILLLTACGEKALPTDPVIPAVRAELLEATAFEATFSVQAINAVTLCYGTDERMDAFSVATL